MTDIQSFATDDFALEHLTDSKGHRQLLDSFSVANNATGLEMYLKSRAMLDEDAKFVYSHVKPRYDQGCVFMYMYV